MSKVTWFKLLAAGLLYAGTAVCAWSQTPLDMAIAATAERLVLAPREALKTLAQLQIAHSPLSPRHQALVVEQMGRAKFYARDYAGALRDGQLLEAPGKQQHDASVECLGVLSQVYAYWMMGQIGTAYELTRRANRYSPAAVNLDARIKALLTRSQLESEDHQPQAAQRTVAQAVLLAAGAHDDALAFMAAKAEATAALATNDMGLAATAVNRLLALGADPRFPERMVRAKAVEYALAAAAGQTARANGVMVETIRLMRQLHLDEALGRTLADYADLQLKTGRYLEAAATAEQALKLDTVSADEQLANSAHFNHAIAMIHLGHVREGKLEVLRLYKSTRDRAHLLAYLPVYAAALTGAGEVHASMQAGVLRQQIETEEALARAKQDEQAREQARERTDSLSRESDVHALPAAGKPGRRTLWLIVALVSAAAWIALLCLYGRSRKGNRLLEETNRQLFTSSNRDPLTGLFNRRYVETYITRVWRRGAESKSVAPAGCGLVLLMDIDHFKGLNDTYGHAIGDKVLQVTAARLSTLFRNEDVVARWGGEEFLALLPTTSASEATAMAARVLGAVSATPVVVNGTSVNVTISLGICVMSLRLKDHEMNWDEVVHTADQALYLAKQNGRNMAYGITDAANTSSADMARGLRMAWDEGKISLVEVFGDGKTSAARVEERQQEERLLQSVRRLTGPGQRKSRAAQPGTGEAGRCRRCLLRRHTPLKIL
jgi:diguanylate cyclase (GGDEF)-like protein